MTGMFSWHTFRLLACTASMLGLFGAGLAGSSLPRDEKIFLSDGATASPLTNPLARMHAAAYVPPPIYCGPPKPLPWPMTPRSGR
jgi:hypothetical protein